jgi:2-polyprenyl-3-methyl-5-hydroxy-6-metoxy-1,4-benzoquinol methylase
MQSRSLKPRKTYPKHSDYAIAPLDSNTSHARILEIIGERKKVLDIGCGNGYLASLLLKRECDVVGIDVNPLAAEEARKYCTSVLVSDLDETILTELLEGRQFDAIVFGDVLEHLHEPARTLDESRALLSERGYIVASIPNVSHGAIRLALLSGRFDYQELGILDDSHLRFFTAKTIDELLLTAGFRVETVDRVTLPLFAESDLVPALDPRDFDEKAVAEIKADPDSETLQFVVKAFPLSNDQRLRTISKRFLTANTELTATKQQVAHRENELVGLRAMTQAQEATIAELREQATRAQQEVEASRFGLKQLEDAYRALEIDALAKQNAALERTLAAQAERAHTIETIADLQSKLEDTERLYAETLAHGEHDVETRDVELAARADALQTQADALRGETAALTRSKLQLEARLHVETERNERLDQELALQRTRVAELSRRSQELQAGSLALEERLREKADLSAQTAALHSAIDALDADVAAARLELSRSRAELQAERQKIASTESDCDELIAEAIAVVDGMRLRVESEQRRLEDQHCRDSSTATELHAQLDAVRKASLADKLVMREYADEFRHRAERAEKDLHGAIRQRDDLYLRVVDADRVIAEASERSGRLDEDNRYLEGRLREECAHTARTDAELAELTARASSLENDLAHQRAVLQHLRESADSDRARAEVAAADLASLTVRYEILQASLAETDNLLVAQTEQLLASTSDERDRLLTLIDTVQSSRFWRLKHWLARLRARLFGAATVRG